MSPKRLRVLISAYACEPFHGSEPEVGWQWAFQMARFHDVTILTCSDHRAGIERGLHSLPPGVAAPAFIFYDQKPWLLALKRRFGITRPYYILWQKGAREVVAKAHENQPFDLLHHITYASYRYPTAIWGHGIPVIWGPVGGMESVPVRLLPWRDLRALFYEVFRNADNALQSLPFSRVPRRAMASAVVLAATLETARFFKKFGVDARLFPTIGIDRAMISDRNVFPKQGPLKLLFVGKLISLKGIELAIEALKLSQTDATLTLVGEGVFRSFAEKSVNRLELNHRVRFLGRQPREAVLKLYSSYDVFLFPSLHDSGAFAVIEAMAQGLPVICLDCGGPAVSVRESCGIRVPLGTRESTIEGLASAIALYDRDRDKLAHDSNNARRAVRENYEWNRKGDQMNSIYRAAMQNDA